MDEKIVYKSEMMSIYFKAREIYFRTEYFQFNIKGNTILDRREFFYETLKEFDSDVKEYCEKMNTKSKYYYFLPYIKNHIYNYVQNCIMYSRYYAIDPVWQKNLFDGLMRKYLDILGFINIYKDENPNWSFENDKSEVFKTILIES